MRTCLRRQAPTLAAALAMTALGVAASVLAAGPARAVPPVGVITEILGSGTTLAGFAIYAAGIKVESKHAAGVTVAHLTFAPAAPPAGMPTQAPCWSSSKPAQ